MAVQGTWGIGGFKIPDLGISEKLFPNSNNPQLYNPAFRPAPKPTAPKQTTNILGAQNTNTGGGYSNYSAPAPSTAPQSSGSNFDYGAYQREQEGILNSQLESVYGPSYNYLNDVEKAYKEQYGTAETNLNQDYEAQKPVLEGMKQNDLAELNTLRRQTGEESESQISKARRLYNELRQGALTRFGGASSTGEAAGELLQRQTGEDMSSIQRQTQERYMKIQDEDLKTNRFYTEKLIGLEKEKRDRLADLKQTFNQQIMSINGKRAELESTKAAKRLEALQGLQSQIMQINKEADQFRQSFDLWKQQKDETLQLAREFGAKNISFGGFEPGKLSSMSFSGGGGNGGTTMQGDNFFNNISDEQKDYLESIGLAPTGMTINNKGTSSLEYGVKQQTFAGVDENGQPIFK